MADFCEAAPLSWNTLGVGDSKMAKPESQLLRVLTNFFLKNCGKRHKIKLHHFKPLVSAKVSSIKYTHNVMQPSPSIAKPFSSSQIESNNVYPFLSGSFHVAPCFQICHIGACVEIS